MTKLLTCSAFGVLSLTFVTTELGASEIVVRAPFTWVRVGPRGPFGPQVFVDAPFAHVRVGQPGALPVEPLVEKLHAPRPAPDSGVEIPAQPAPPVLTLRDFAQAIPTSGGDFEVVFLHPHVRQPVLVKFRLPPGVPKRVRVERDEIRLDYGKVEVELEFKRDGRVKIEYDD